MVQTSALTEEQRAVVRHEEGPAVVRAVPGAGKTTALVHRIRHLVQNCGVAPDRILASSFSRDTVQDLEMGLTRLGVPGVDTRTLHALGLSLLRRTGTVGPSLDGSSPDPSAAARILARRTLTELVTERDLDTGEIGISPQDLADQVAAWKQQLAYPDSELKNQSEAVRKHTQTATHENEDFVTLYRRFEALRRQEGWLTYPDMLRDGWAVLLHDDSLRSQLQKTYRYVLVDEFQDVSRVQHHLLDLLTAQHKNYMVIGDADQCIYGWRGANPSFLTRFVDRYDADEYVLTDSFRLPAAPLVLANALIDKDDDRQPKRLHLTQGFSGRTDVLQTDSPQAAAAQVADAIGTLQNDGVSPNEITILVRTYGQTPPLERAMIDQGHVYRLRGHVPFYRRREVQTLLRYLYWALLERRLQKNGWFADPATAKRYTDRFSHVLKIPNRYVQHGRIDRIVQQARARETSVLNVLTQHLSGMHERTAERVTDFLDVAEALLDRLDAPPNDTLGWLIEALDYEAALRERSAFTVRGDARVRTARALVQYADGHNSALDLLQSIRSLAVEQQRLDDDTPAVSLRSIHRAKGAEWPVVIVPGCTEGTLPLALDADETPDVNEERRLFYVALTRPREHLILVSDDSDERSRFLEEAEADTQLDAVRHIRNGLSAPSSLSDHDLAHLCRHLAELGLEHYVRKWWPPSAEQKTALRARLDALGPAIARATKRRNAYRQAHAEYTAQRALARENALDRLDALRATLGTASLTATNEQPDTYYPDDAAFTFDWVDDASQIGLFWDGTHAGTLNPFGTHRLDAPTLLDLPWDAIVGRFDCVAQGRSALRFTIDWAETETLLMERAVDTPAPPDPPSDLTHLLTSDAFEHGYDVLCEALRSPAPQSS